MKTMQKGFTLIELMIVVAIIAILAAIAIPQYQNYITKSQFSETQTIADGLKTPIVEYVNQTGNCPGNANGVSQAASYVGKYVATAAVNTGNPPCTITVTFKAAGSVSKPLGGNKVVFKGTDNQGSFSWLCEANGNDGSSNIDTKYKPQACQ